MTNISESDRMIAKYIENDDYYKDAYSWYCQKYLFMISHNAFVLLILLIMAATFVGMAYTYSLNVVSKKYPFPIYAYDETEYFPYITPLAATKEPIAISVSRYLLGKYIELRESYNFSNYSGDNRNIQVGKVQALSSRKVVKQYLDYIDPETNPGSPMVLYKMNISKKVKITKVEFITSNQAEVYYDSTLYNAKGIDDSGTDSPNGNVSQWKATVKFRLSDIENVLTKKQKLSFVVTDYQTIKL